MWTPENFGGFWKKARSAAADVRFGSKADIHGPQRDVRFTPESGHQAAGLRCPFCANSGHSVNAKMLAARLINYRYATENEKSRHRDPLQGQLVPV
jgi:hypothetical protein